MAEIQMKPHLTQPQSSCFRGCFGFSQKVSKNKSFKAAESGSRRKNSWFSWLRFRMKKSAVKTVPVDTEPIKRIPSKSKLKSKSDKLSSKSEPPVTGPRPPSQIQAAEAVTTDQVAIEEPQETRYEPAQNINLENRKHLDHSGVLKDDTCKKRLSFCRKIEAIRAGSSLPNSSETKPKPKPKPKLAAKTSLSHSSSFPAPKHEKRVVNPMARSRVMLQKPKFDPMIGMSIIVVTLVIMLLWGRLCAILCTSAWFYFVPCLKIGISSNDVMKNNLNLSDLDLNSEEHKKKVVLEGFLERNHHNRNNSLGIL